MSRVLTLVLPFAPDDRELHDALIAQASALGGRFAAVEVLQLVPAANAAPARTSSAPLGWWEIVNPQATADAEAQTLTSLVAQALASEPLRGRPARLVVLPAPHEAVAAGLAATLGGSTLGRCTAFAIEGEAVIATRLAFGGRLATQVRADDPWCCATWRPASGPAVALRPVDAAAVRRIAIDGAPAPQRDIEVTQPADRQPRLEGAPLVVGGGRGMAGEQGFALLARIAASLDAALGGSLPAVDAGLVPVARQIGQSGKFVTPRLYFAVGISGTPQHLAGIGDRTRIVAVNKDPDAPIFAVADAGVVADWREVLPLLAEQLEARRAVEPAAR